MNEIQYFAVELASKKYFDKHGIIINNNNNHMSYGVSQDSNGQPYIVIYLTNENNIKKLPTEFEGYPVDIKVIGEVFPA